MTSVTHVQVRPVQDGGPYDDAPWTHVKATHDDRRSEAGVQQMDSGLWGVWGWRPAEGDELLGACWLDSTHDTEQAATSAAHRLVLERLAPRLGRFADLDEDPQDAPDGLVLVAGQLYDAESGELVDDGYPPPGTRCAGCGASLPTDSADAEEHGPQVWLCPDCVDLEADVAIDAQATQAHVGLAGPDLHPDWFDHARAIALLKLQPEVEDAYDAHTGGGVYVVEAALVTPEGQTLQVVAQASLQGDRWLMGVELRSQLDVEHGFNAIPHQGLHRSIPAVIVARDLVAIAHAVGKGQPDGRGLPSWVDGLERYTAGEPHVIPAIHERS